ncbi:MAG TPA: cytochrome c [Rhodanobacteraceae bacterium]|nr:cytochrome c [Rhodanobacteraceae bacterium]
MLVSGPTLAQGQGNKERGRIMVYTCAGCHGVTGYENAYPRYHVPRIAGQNYEYIVSALNEYKKGTRSHPTMQAQAESFSQQDIMDIASYLSSIKVGPGPKADTSAQVSKP